ncbi:MAG: TetR family transcriptional regulator [Pseudomonadota bacterium]|nr:TetR family transcriptional regulator [Pseudomonadota bacterium]
MDTREKLLLTAERLFGERGLNGVSLREITREAGQRNASALHYHFGSREGLISAIFEKRMHYLDQRRMEYLDEVEAEGRAGDMRAVAEAAIRPIAEFLWRDDGSSNYVRFLTEMFVTPEFLVSDFVRNKHDLGLQRSYRMVRALVPDIPDNLMRQRFLLVLHAGTYALADIDTARQRRAREGKPFDLARAIENLIDLWVGAMSAPVTEQTAMQAGWRSRPERGTGRRETWATNASG